MDSTHLILQVFSYRIKNKRVLCNVIAHHGISSQCILFEMIWNGSSEELGWHDSWHQLGTKPLDRFYCGSSLIASIVAHTWQSPGEMTKGLNQKTIVNSTKTMYFYGFLYIVQQTLSNTWDCVTNLFQPSRSRNASHQVFQFFRGTSSWGKGDPPANVRLGFILLLVVHFGCISIILQQNISNLTFESLFFLELIEEFIL